MKKLTAQELYDSNYYTFGNKINEIVGENEKLKTSLQYLAMKMSDRDEQDYIQHINELLNN